MFAVRARTEQFALSLVYTRSVVRTYTLIARHPALIASDNAPNLCRRTLVRVIARYSRSVVHTYTLVARLSDLCKEDTDYLFAAGQKCPHARQSEWNERTPRIGSSVTLAAAALTGCFSRLACSDLQHLFP